MSLLEYALFLALGRLCVWLVQTAGPFQWLWTRHPKLTEFGQCDLCVGIWVYLALALLVKQEPMLTFLLWQPLEDILLAEMTAFVAHLLRLGWNAKFQTVIVE